MSLFGSGSPAGERVKRTHGGRVKRTHGGRVKRTAPAGGNGPVARKKTGSPAKKAADRKADAKHNDDKKKAKKKKGGGTSTPAPADTTTTEKLKAKSTQSGQDAMAAAPSTMPTSADAAAYDNSVFSTGPGEAVEYNYVRVDGGGAEDYALQQSAYTAPVPAIAGFGQVLTPAAATGTASGAANNPT